MTELQHKLKVTEVDQSLEPGTAILYPIVFPDRLVMIVSLNNQSGAALRYSGDC